MLPFPQAIADTTGHWRFDDAGAADGGTATSASNTASPGTLDAAAPNGTPLYSADVVKAEIYDPVADAVLTNAFSLDVSAPNAFLEVPSDVVFDTSFTVEFFIKLGGEPASYETFLRRRQFADLLWQVDFDHAVYHAFGRVRSRWDTPAGAPDDIAQDGIDENFNFVLGPLGGATASRIYIDTGAKDALGNNVGDQNTGSVSDYIFDAASANPNETDVALQGDGLNDLDDWHHIALTFDEITGEIMFYVNYGLAQSRTLLDTELDGYTHPAAPLQFGKLSGGDYGLLIDEVRYSDTILTPGEFLRPNSDTPTTVVAHWRMEDDGVEKGAAVVSLENAVSPLHPATTAGGAPTYSDDVPGAMIYDPVADVTLPNKFSLDVSAIDSRVSAANDTAFDTSFTAEMFIKLIDQPGGYHSFLRRQEFADRRWQIDFDHAPNGAFGRARTRWDTPAGVPDNNAHAGVDENVNFVVGPTGGASVPDEQRLYIDTDAGDGLSASYDDPSDWANDGDGVNAVGSWRHVAITFDEETGTVSYYFDHELIQSRTLSDSEADGYTHPAAQIVFGKLAASDYGLLMDEVRYTGAVLFPNQFLQAILMPEPDFAIVDFSYDETAHTFSLSWPAVIDEFYAIDRFNEATSTWDELDDSVLADADPMSFTDMAIPAGLRRAIYRVREGDQG